MRADDEAWNAGAVVVHLGKPLLADVLERCGGCDAEADEEDVGLGVGEGAKAVVVFLSGCVEQAEGVGFVADPRCREAVLAGICETDFPLSR